jgi:trans-aconitate methyltransferase
LEDRWYDALKRGFADYDVYGETEYIGELWVNWYAYTRNFLKDIRHKKALFGKSIVDDLSAIPCVVDLGCGMGSSTSALSQMFPDSHVYGHNLDNTAQMTVCRQLARRFGFSVITDLTQVNEKGGLVFASAYFEHIKAPIDHLWDVIEKLNPEAFLIANYFNISSVGHFHVYDVGTKRYHERDLSMIFNDSMRRFGYEKVKTGLWNNTPNYWRKAQ